MCGMGQIDPSAISKPTHSQQDCLSSSKIPSLSRSNSDVFHCDRAVELSSSIQHKTCCVNTRRDNRVNLLRWDCLSPKEPYLYGIIEADVLSYE